MRRTVAKKLRKASHGNPKLYRALKKEYKRLSRRDRAEMLDQLK